MTMESSPEPKASRDPRGSPRGSPEFVGVAIAAGSLASEGAKANPGQHIVLSKKDSHLQLDVERHLQEAEAAADASTIVQQPKPQFVSSGSVIQFANSIFQTIPQHRSPNSVRVSWDMRPACPVEPRSGESRCHE